MNAKLVDTTVNEVRMQLTDELRRAPWQGSDNSVAGHCYVASEAVFHLLGGKSAGLDVYRLMMPDGFTHWFLTGPFVGVIDPTVDQFDSEPAYERATRTGFLTSQPSARAQVVIDRVLVRRGVS